MSDDQKILWSAMLEHRRAGCEQVESNCGIAFRNMLKTDVRDGIDVFLVTDVSGSMSGEPIKRVRDVHEFLINERFQAGLDRICSITFDHRAILRYALTSDGDAWRQGLNDLVADGGTRLAKGLQLAFEQIKASSSPSRRPVIVILTDGATADAKDIYANMNVWMQSVAPCVPAIVTLGFTRFHDQPLLQAIVNASPHGCFMSVPDLDQVVGSMGTFFSHYMHPVSVQSATFTVNTFGALIGDIRVGQGEAVSGGTNRATITVTNVEADRQRHLLVPLTLSAVSAPCDDYVGTVDALFVFADGTQQASGPVPLVVERVHHATREASNVNIMVVNEKARMITFGALEAAYQFVTQANTSSALGAISSAEDQINLAIPHSEGEPMTSIPIKVHQSHLQEGKKHVEKFDQRLKLSTTEGLQAYYLTETLAFLADVSAAELNERPTALVPQYNHDNTDNLLEKARDAGLTTADVVPADKSFDALPERMAALKPVNLKQVRLNDIGNFTRDLRGGMHAELQKRILERLKRLDDPNGAENIERRIKELREQNENRPVVTPKNKLGGQTLKFKRPAQPAAPLTTKQAAAAPPSPLQNIATATRVTFKKRPENVVPPTDPSPAPPSPVVASRVAVAPTTPSPAVEAPAVAAPAVAAPVVAAPVVAAPTTPPVAAAPTSTATVAASPVASAPVASSPAAPVLAVPTTPAAAPAPVVSTPPAPAPTPAAAPSPAPAASPTPASSIASAAAPGVRREDLLPSPSSGASPVAELVAKAKEVPPLVSASVVGVPTLVLMPFLGLVTALVVSAMGAVFLLIKFQPNNVEGATKVKKMN